MSFIFILFVFKISMVIINVVSKSESVRNIGIYYDDALLSKENWYTQLFFTEKFLYVFVFEYIFLTIDKENILIRF